MNQLSFAFHQPSGWSPKSAGLKLLQIEEIIRRQDGLGLADAAIFTALCWFAGKAGCYPSHESIADRAGVSIATVKRSLSKLRETGFVSWERQSGRRGNRYRFHRSEEFWSPCRPRETKRLASPRARRKIAQSERIKSLNLSDKQERRTQEASPSGLAKRDACSPEPAGPVKEALEEVVGTVPEGDRIPGALSRLARAHGAKASDMARWIREKAAGRSDIRGFGWFVAVARDEFAA